MSLATTGGGIGGMGGAGAGGLAMAHTAHAMAQPVQPNAPPAAEIPVGSAPPANLAALGADLVDKHQQLSLKQVKDLSEMPIVAIDLYSTEPIVAAVPPKPKDPASEDVTASLVGKMKDKIALKTTETAHKTFRKWLSKNKTYEDLQSDVLTKSDDEAAVVIENPELWLGLRRLEEGPVYLKKMVTHDDSDSPAIAEESTQGVGVVLANGTLDGSVPSGDDFDRVVCKVRLHDSKKSLTVLPEEILQLILNQAQYHVARKMKADGVKKSDCDDNPDDVTNYPCALAVPAPYCNDQSVEALLDATGNTGVVFQRSVCALAGALIPTLNQEKPNLLLVTIQKSLQERHKEFQKELIKNPEARFDDKILLLLAGMTKDTAECTAIEISSKQESIFSCLFGNFQVMCNVSYRSENPESIMKKCITELYENLDTIAPESSVPLGMITYGTSSEQKTIQDIWERLQKGLEDWENVATVHTKSDCVAIGTGVLGAVSHGRLSKLVEIPGKKRPKTELAIQVQNVAPVAVGIMKNYFGGQKEKWTSVKTVFDFDRRVPAGPYGIELTAAECSLHRKNEASNLSEEDFLKAVKDREAAKYIPEREEAALNLRVQIVQKFTRDGEWTNIGDVMSPLVVVEKDESKTACEKVVLELSLGISGLLSNALVGDR
jgi:hypothetical protein